MRPRDIQNLGPQERVELMEKAKAGDREAVRDFVLSAIWQKIVDDKFIPFKKKAKVFGLVADAIELNIDIIQKGS